MTLDKSVAWRVGGGGLLDACTTSTTGVFVPLQQYNIITSDGGSTIGSAYFKTQTGGTLTGQIATLMVRTTIAHSLFDAYGLQTHLTFGSSCNVSTTDANAHLTALSAKVTFNTSTVTKGWVTAGLFIIEGGGTCSQMCHGVSIVNEAGSTGAQSMLHLNDDVGTVPYFSFAGSAGSGKGIYIHTSAGTQLGTIKVLVNGTAYWLPLMQAE
jgi:hypothetical protein